MIFEVIFINKENHLKKFITSGENEEKCKELAKRYIKQKGGAIGPARMNEIKRVPSLNNLCDYCVLRKEKYRYGV